MPSILNIATGPPKTLLQCLQVQQRMSCFEVSPMWRLCSMRTQLLLRDLLHPRSHSTTPPSLQPTVSVRGWKVQSLRRLLSALERPAALLKSTNYWKKLARAATVCAGGVSTDPQGLTSHKYTNANTEIHVYKYKYTNANTRIEI